MNLWGKLPLQVQGKIIMTEAGQITEGILDVVTKHKIHKLVVGEIPDRWVFYHKSWLWFYHMCLSKRLFYCIRITDCFCIWSMVDTRNYSKVMSMHYKKGMLKRLTYCEYNSSDSLWLMNVNVAKLLFLCFVCPWFYNEPEYIGGRYIFSLFYFPWIYTKHLSHQFCWLMLFLLILFLWI